MAINDRSIKHKHSSLRGRTISHWTIRIKETILTHLHIHVYILGCSATAMFVIFKESCVTGKYHKEITEMTNLSLCWPEL